MGCTGPTQPSIIGCLLVGGVTTGSSLSAIWSATLYPTCCLRMSQASRPSRVLYRHIEVLVRAHHDASSSWQYAATCRAVSRPSPHEQTGVITSGTRRSNKKARSPIFPVPLFEVRRSALAVPLLVVHRPVPQHVLDALPSTCRPLSATVLSTLSQVWSGSSFGPRSRDRWLATVSPFRLSRCCVLAAWYSGVGDSGVPCYERCAAVSDKLSHA